jgi:hypothetical protein
MTMGESMKRWGEVPSTNLGTLGSNHQKPSKMVPLMDQPIQEFHTIP